MSKPGKRIKLSDCFVIQGDIGLNNVSGKLSEQDFRNRPAVGIVRAQLGDTCIELKSFVHSTVKARYLSSLGKQLCE